LIRMDDAWLRREHAGFAAMGQESVFERLRAHLVADPGSERPFTLFDSAGEWIAGNRLNIPADLLMAAPLDKPFKFSLRREGGLRDFRGMVHRTDSGNLLLIAQDTSGAERFDEVLVHALLLGGGVTGLLGLVGAGIAGADAVRRIDAV